MCDKSTNTEVAEELDISLAKLEEMLASQCASIQCSSEDSTMQSSIVHTLEEEYRKLDEQYRKRRAVLDRSDFVRSPHHLFG